MSIIKRVDNLGRLVLPKSVRKSLNIKSNDEVEIITDSNQIVVKKYNLLDQKEEFLNNIINSISKLLPKETYVMVTDTNMALFVSNLEYKGIKLSNKYLLLLNSRKAFDEKIMPTFCPFVNFENIYLKDAHPVLIDSNIYGSLAIISEDYNYNISKELDSIVRFATEMIKKIM